MRWHLLVPTSRLKEAAGADEESSHQKEARPRIARLLAQRASLLLADQRTTVLKAPCSRKSMANESKKMIQPEKVWKNPSAMSGLQYSPNIPP